LFSLWQSSSTDQSTTPSFSGLRSLIFLSGTSTLLFPLSHYLLSSSTLFALISLFSASFLFFLFSTAPKIGSATILQMLVADTSYARSVFGFVAAFLVNKKQILVRYY
jgi:hypothetical protein